ncbi:MAG: GDSL-type esterase/lipase family protein [Oscillospiraceae bacterium]|nr:GDSL-type esterase/lipase family protein [Oscillospiraceae bacterium]MDD4367699.1 GDSL-type esterase/lipase family protein [Oscillospiraceae bacterium]
MKALIWDEPASQYRVLRPSPLRQAELPGIIRFQNHAQIGATTEHALKTVPPFLASDRAGEAVLLEFGGNDCDFNWREVAANPDLAHQPHVLPERFTHNLTQLIRLIQSRHMLPLLMTLPPVDGPRYLAFLCRQKYLDPGRLLSFLGDANRISRFQEHYSWRVQQLAGQLNCPLVEVRQAFLTRSDFHALICADGIHPSSSGHDLIASCINAFWQSAAASPLWKTAAGV